MPVAEPSGEGTVAVTSSGPYLQSLALQVRDFVWPFGDKRRRRKLRRLRQAALNHPSDEGKQAAYLRELLDVSPRAVVTRVDRGGFATGPRVAAEYVKALVHSKKIEDYAQHDRAEGGQFGESGGQGDDEGSVGMTRLLVRLVSLSKGFGDAAQAQRQTEGTSAEPLHVVVMGSGGGLGQGRPQNRALQARRPLLLPDARLRLLLPLADGERADQEVPEHAALPADLPAGVPAGHRAQLGIRPQGVQQGEHAGEEREDLQGRQGVRRGLGGA